MGARGRRYRLGRETSGLDLQPPLRFAPQLPMGPRGGLYLLRGWPHLPPARAWPVEDVCQDLLAVGGEENVLPILTRDFTHYLLGT